AEFYAAKDHEQQADLLIQIVERIQWENLIEAMDLISEYAPFFDGLGDDFILPWRIVSSLPSLTLNPAQQVLDELRALSLAAQEAGLPLWSAKAAHFAGWLAVQLGDYPAAFR
ncbi:hypothetical protein RZS08_47615, partial [Arthrospira platensis SPKY1]|nr:hypothetical protein [Arthrospira platensis SPKY1]